VPLFDFLELLNLKTTLKIKSYDNKHHKKNITKKTSNKDVYILLAFFGYFYSQHKVVTLLQVDPFRKGKSGLS
jgi:hypothetical protein